jgi:hypothetical protein
MDRQGKASNGPVVACPAGPGSAAEKTCPKQHQYPDIDYAAFAALGIHEICNLTQCDPVHGDILMLRATALADLLQCSRPEERERLACHAGRGAETTEILDPARAITGFFFQFAGRRRLCVFACRFVADQAGGQFQAVCLERHPILFDQNDVIAGWIIIDGKENRGADPAHAAHIFPPAFLMDRQIIAGPMGPFSVGQWDARSVVHVHFCRGNAVKQSVFEIAVVERSRDGTGRATAFAPVDILADHGNFLILDGDVD